MSNTITINGRLAKDGELKYSQNGKAMLRFTIPDQKRRFNRETSEWENASDTTWFTATVFEQEAEDLTDQAVKGAPVSITGRLITRNWTNSNGEARVSLEIDQPQIVVGKPRQNHGQNSNQWNPSTGQGGFNQPAGDPWATNHDTAEAPF